MSSVPTAVVRATILVVDDQETNVQVVGTLLDTLGFDIVPATSGEQALKRMAARLPDLVLLDVLMPGLDGIETCRRIRAEPSYASVPIIFLSAADDKNLIVEGLESGGADYVTKPFNKAELVSRVRQHLALKQARDELRSLAREREQLLGIIAQDLRMVVTAMQSGVERLHLHLGDAADPKSGALLRELRVTGIRALEIVDALGRKAGAKEP